MKLMQEWPQGSVVTTAWAKHIGISRQLLKRYQDSGWIERLGWGAYKKPGDELSWQGGLYALQEQMRLPVHVGGMTALSHQGLAHYLRLGTEDVFLYSPLGTRLPAWFGSHHWGVSIEHIRTSFLPETIGVMVHDMDRLPIQVAAPERAILECLYLAPQHMDLIEIYDVLEGLVNLRPSLMQDLLEACSSIQVKRLFLYMAEKAAHHWLPFLDTSRIGLGSGDRSIVQGGVYVASHRLIVPKELDER